MMNQGANQHCVKSVRIRSYPGPYFPAFGLNAKRYSVSLRIQSECGEMRTRITPNTDTFYAVLLKQIKKEMKRHRIVFSLSSEEIKTNILDHEWNRLVASDKCCRGAISITTILILNPLNSCHGC